MKHITTLILVFSLSIINAQKKSGMHSQEKFESIFENMNWDNKIITGNGKISVAQDRYTEKVMTIIEAIIIRMQNYMLNLIQLMVERMLKMI